MDPKQTVESLWDDMHHRRWENLRRYFAEDAVIDWHDTGERFSVDDFVNVNGEYPGQWAITVEKLHAAGDTVVSAVKVTDGESTFFAASFFTFAADKIVHLDEYWSEASSPPRWRLDRKWGTRIPG